MPTALLRQGVSVLVEVHPSSPEPPAKDLFSTEELRLFNARLHILLALPEINTALFTCQGRCDDSTSAGEAVRNGTRRSITMRTRKHLLQRPMTWTCNPWGSRPSIRFRAASGWRRKCSVSEVVWGMQEWGESDPKEA